MALCPHCETVVGHANLEVVGLSDETGGQWRGISYSCPHCLKVLSMGFDPVALEDDLVKRVLKAVRTGSE